MVSTGTSLSPSAGVSAGVSTGTSLSPSAGVSAGVSTGTSLSPSAGVSAVVSTGTSPSSSTDVSLLPLFSFSIISFAIFLDSSSPFLRSSINLSTDSLILSSSFLTGVSSSPFSSCFSLSPSEGVSLVVSADTSLSPSAGVSPVVSVGTSLSPSITGVSSDFISSTSNLTSSSFASGVSSDFISSTSNLTSSSFASGVSSDLISSTSNLTISSSFPGESSDLISSTSNLTPSSSTTGISSDFMSSTSNFTSSSLVSFSPEVSFGSSTVTGSIVAGSGPLSNNSSVVGERDASTVSIDSATGISFVPSELFMLSSGIFPLDSLSLSL